jgi:hypothetical protein
MKIPKEQVLSKKIVGKRGTANVWLVRTVGGLNLICVESPGNAEIAAMASHPAMAEFLAQKKSPDIEYTSLRKSVIQFDENNPTFKKYEALTNAIIDIQKKQ